MVSVVAQSDGDSIGCRFVVDRVVEAETISHRVQTFTAFMSKAA